MARLACLMLAAVGAFVQSAPMARQKILCLHGGGGNGRGQAVGMQALITSLPQYEFVFPDGGYSVGSSANSHLWIQDPPGGKGAPTTASDWADDSFAVLDNLVASQGPFYGILGYSQGSAFVPIYLAHAPLGTFKVAFMFCGYLTTTHQGLLGLVNNASPFGGIPALVWQGARDTIISNAMTAEQAAKFTLPTVITSSEGGHVVPSNGDSTYNRVVAFMEVSTRAGSGGGGGLVIGSIDDAANTGGNINADSGKDITAAGCTARSEQQQCAGTAGCTWYAGYGCYGTKGTTSSSGDKTNTGAGKGSSSAKPEDGNTDDSKTQDGKTQGDKTSADKGNAASSCTHKAQQLCIDAAGCTWYAGYGCYGAKDTSSGGDKTNAGIGMTNTSDTGDTTNAGTGKESVNSSDAKDGHKTTLPTASSCSARHRGRRIITMAGAALIAAAAC